MSTSAPTAASTSPPTDHRTTPPRDPGGHPWIRLVRTSRRPPWPRWAVLVVVGWLALGYLAEALAKRSGNAAPGCVFKRVTTQPCPTCGSGRGTLALLHGDVFAALHFNPLYFTLLGLAGMLLMLRVIFARKFELTLSWRGRRVAWGIFLTLVATDWAYLIVMGI